MPSRRIPSILIAASGVAAILLALIACVWAFLFFGVYIGYGNYKVRGHQEFAANGVAQIEPAQQMDRLFPDCRHYITYNGPNQIPLFTSVAYFGDRYRLTMQVPVDIESETSGSTSGEPRFHLNEISAISILPSGQIRASFSCSLDFGPAQWKQVCNSNGDFSTVGFTVNTTPVLNFQRYADATRPSN